MKASSIEEAVTASSSCIALIATYDLEVTKSNTAIPLMLTELIRKTALFLNVNRNMDIDQVRQTVELIMSDHVCKNLTPEDFKVCFDMIKKNRFEKNTFERFDGQIIFENLYAYANEKAIYVEQQKRTQHEIKKREPVSEQVLGGLKTLVEKLKKETRPKPYSGVLVEKNTKEKNIQKYFQEFFDVWKLNPVDDKLGKFIEYKGEVVNEEGYVKARLKEDENLNL